MVIFPTGTRNLGPNPFLVPVAISLGDRSLPPPACVALLGSFSQSWRLVGCCGVLPTSPRGHLSSDNVVEQDRLVLFNNNEHEPMLLSLAVRMEQPQACDVQHR
jgi:hypothetical protein